MFGGSGYTPTAKGVAKMRIAESCPSFLDPACVFRKTGAQVEGLATIFGHDGRAAGRESRLLHDAWEGIAMRLYLLRHGQAVPKTDDEDRPLSDAGVACIEEVSAALRKMGLHFDLIVASPKLRSRQTAAIVADTVGYDAGKIETTAAIKPSAPPRDAIRFLRDFIDREHVLMAGHLPSLEEIGGYFVTSARDLIVDFPCGGLMVIDVPELKQGAGQLLSFTRPEQLALVTDRPRARR